MNIELYIQSGIVESYALGLASPMEKSEFEQLLPHYPELKETLSEFEYQLELLSLDGEESPPNGSKERMEARLRKLPVVRPATRAKEHSRRSTSPGYIPVKVTSPYIKVHKNWRTFLLVLFILSNILLALSIYFFLEYRHAHQQLIKQEQAGYKN